MGRLAGYSYHEIVRRLRLLGFAFDRQGKGSHELWRHRLTGRKTALPRHPGDIAEGTLRAVLREAGIEPEEFLAL
jgi:predicted RNA binding protein YcfA (HicA-like mRNA interferase family)